MVTIMCFVVSEKNPEKCRIVSVLRSLKFYHQFNFITIQAAKLILSNKSFCWCLKVKAKIYCRPSSISCFVQPFTRSSVYSYSLSSSKGKPRNLPSRTAFE